MVDFSLSSQETRAEGAPGSLFIRTPIPAGGASGKEPACQCSRFKTSLGGEDPLEEGMATHSSILAWRILIAWRATDQGVTTETDTTEVT